MLKPGTDQEVVDTLLKSNAEFRALYEEHIELEQELEALYSLKYFPPEVESKLKQIKVTKLRNKDRMNQLIAEIR